MNLAKKLILKNSLDDLIFLCHHLNAFLKTIFGNKLYQYDYHLLEQGFIKTDSTNFFCHLRCRLIHVHKYISKKDDRTTVVGVSVSPYLCLCICVIYIYISVSILHLCLHLCLYLIHLYLYLYLQG